MYSSICIKPYHLPILVAMAFVLLTQSDARIPKKIRVLPHPQLLHHHNHKKEASDHASPTPSPLESPENIVDFTKRMYNELGRDHGNATLVSEAFKSEFDELNSLTDGNFGRSLIELFEIRMMDLQRSIKYARRMRDAVGQLTYDTIECVACTPKPSV